MNNLYKIALIGILTIISSVSYSQESNKIKILFVVTSHDQLGDTDKKTGLWIEEFATPYYYLIDQGIEVVITSPKGGQPPIDPKSTLVDYQTKSTKRYYADSKAQLIFSKTLKLAKVKHEDFDAVFYPGGHGPLWDLSKDKKSIELIESFYNNNKPIAFVCHAPAALQKVNDLNGDPLVKGKKVTGFTNGEEKAVGLTDVVPFLIEDMLKENGGIYVKGDDWSAFAVEDGLLISGQNPQSANLVAKMLIEKLKKH
ncbi:type 1 glutamine amidotransferase domain-containing protein [Aestuariivivens insulae]|uniref:type 1 glutamine amidotransferase domain-containing protein n=1 Tax=Aestuariivivens insulae TaxID=1621988 RepID=UPI001F59010B|nr:type 1 glutamine amidotransferase domain-containing protein [Aestuariivivens insulae]